MTRKAPAVKARTSGSIVQMKFVKIKTKKTFTWIRLKAYHLQLVHILLAVLNYNINIAQVSEKCGHLRNEVPCFCRLFWLQMERDVRILSADPPVPPSEASSHRASIPLLARVVKPAAL